MLFKVTNKDNKGNVIYIQGAYSKDTTSDVAKIVFQNYDEDTNFIYNMAGLSTRDAFGTATSNGLGDLLFLTNSDGGSNLSEKMRIKYNGQVAIGSNIPLSTEFNNSMLSVYGGGTISSNLTIQQNNYTNGELYVGSYSSFCNNVNISTNHSNVSLCINQQGTGDIFNALTSNNSKFIITNAGNIGIDTAIPSRKLDVNGDINFQGMIYQNNTVFPREPLVHTFKKIITKNKDYTVLLSWVNDLSFSNIRNTKSIMTKASILPGYKDDTSSSNFNYSLRIYDVTNNHILAENTFSNQNPSLVQLTLSNLSRNTLSELELQGKLGSVGSNLCIENMMFKYD